MEFTPDNLAKLPDDGVFVFGSNTDGEHCGGAALVALKRFGAVNGQAEGPQGRSYATPTMGYWDSFSYGTTEVLRYKIRISFDELVAACDRFVLYTSQHPELRFYVTKVGCGIAGWKVDEVAQAFAVALGSFLVPLPDNIVWPREFYEILQSHGLVG
jgi:hypothetical protein